MTRYIVYGAGGVGGTIGACLHAGGFNVVLVARGEHYRAIADRGLLFITPAGSRELQLPVVDLVSKLDLGHDDVVILSTKSQDSYAALSTLATVAPKTTPIVCCQNGVENERMALRPFENVHAMCVGCPATHLSPGVVKAHSAPFSGIFDVGRYPSGTDSFDHELSAALRACTFVSDARPDVMAWKYAKLVRNLGNAPDALLRSRSEAAEIVSLARQEGAAVLHAAGIDFVGDEAFDDWERQLPVVHSEAMEGTSSWQSLARESGAIETDYLNGEIVLLGRMHGMPTPVNQLLTELADEVARRKEAPRTLSKEEFFRRLGVQPHSGSDGRSAERSA